LKRGGTTNQTQKEAAVAPTLTLPRNSDELAEMIHDPKRREEILATPDSLTDFIDGYAKDQAGRDPGQAQQIRDEVERVWADTLRKDQIDAINRVNLTPGGAAKPRNRAYCKTAPGAKLDAKFDNWGTYLQATWARNQSMDAIAARDEITKIQNAFGSTVPSDGGFLIPETLRADLLSVALEDSIVRPLATVVPMDSLSVPYPTIDVTSNASSVYGGVVGYWTEEAGALTESAPSFGRVVLTAKKLTIYSEVPNELFQDSIISLQSFMATQYPKALAWFEDRGFFDGTGVGEPLGFMRAPAQVAVAKETGQAADSVVLENIVKMYSRMLPSSLNRAVWIANNDVFPQLATMALSVGTGGSAVWLTNAADGAPMRILGRPVLFTEKANTVGDLGDLNFVDLSYYLIGDRQMVQADTSSEYKFANDKTALRIIERVDGQPWIRSAITPAEGSNSLSPFVALAARS
jgi:HK97 family phage major capsid protein